MTAIFDAVAQALASLLGTDTTSAGYILGFITVIALVIIIGWALGDQLTGTAIVIPPAIGVVFVALAGWWPLWTIILIALVLVLVVMDPFSTAGG